MGGAHGCSGVGAWVAHTGGAAQVAHTECARAAHGRRTGGARAAHGVGSYRACGRGKARRARV
eukprot:2574633-Prymnesium_polylepis.1